MSVRLKAFKVHLFWSYRRIGTDHFLSVINTFRFIYYQNLVKKLTLIDDTAKAQICARAVGVTVKEKYLTIRSLQPMLRDELTHLQVQYQHFPVFPSPRPPGGPRVISQQ